jgi:hypothetical protein
MIGILSTTLQQKLARAAQVSSLPALNMRFREAVES